MRKTASFRAVSLLFCAAGPLALVLEPLPAAETPSAARVRLETTVGVIEFELDLARAPATSANFLRYIEARKYDSGAFHRTVTPGNQPMNSVKIEVGQGGPRGQDCPPIALERTSKTGILHKDGVLSMARAGADTATGDFFICIGDQPELDFGGKRNPDGQGFAAFGRVTAGMDVVRKIQRSAADGQKLTPPIAIMRARRLP